MILGEPVFGAVVVFAIVAPERKINLDATPLAFQTQRAPFPRSICSLPTFNVNAHRGLIPVVILSNSLDPVRKAHAGVRRTIEQQLHKHICSIIEMGG
jgi:hypothetical protein